MRPRAVARAYDPGRMSKLFFDGSLGLYRTAIIGVLAYVLLVLMLRVSGKRTLAKLNAFDLIVTVALGSTLATVLLTKDVALAEGALGLALLIGMQFVVAWASVRVGWLRRAVRAEPALLLRRGHLLRDAMRDQRVTEGEVLASVRGAGIARLADVEAVVLETDGSISVVPRPAEGHATSLRDVPGTGDDGAPADASGAPAAARMD
jgi:uncharacterized membrane protein YcaP (DUF421 family)